MPEAPHIVEIPARLLYSILTIGAAQAAGMLAILWKGARWTARVEGELRLIRQSLTTHIDREFTDLRRRVESLEKSR